jgi:putative membrane protein
MNRHMERLRTRIAVCAALLVVASSNALGATSSAGAAQPAQFLQKAMLGSMLEVELGEVAQRNAATTGIHALGSRMVRDHGKIGRILQMLSKDKGVVVPASLASDDRSTVTALSTKTGVEFDAAYAQRMVVSHEKLIALFDEATTGSDPDVAEFARRALPILREGKRLAEVYREVTSRHVPAQPEARTVAQAG